MLPCPISWTPGKWENGLRLWRCSQDARFSILQGPEGFTLQFASGSDRYRDLAWEAKPSIPAAQDAARSVIGEPPEAVERKHRSRLEKVVLGPLEVSTPVIRDY